MMLDLGTGYLPDFVMREVLPNLPRQSGEGIHKAVFNLGPGAHTLPHRGRNRNHPAQLRRSM